MIAKGMSKSRAIVPTTAHDRFTIQGHVSPGFEAVREAFADNFVWRRELGGACCAFNGGEKVVDLWGQLLAHQAGLFELNEPIDRSLLAELDRLAVVLARQKPAW